MKLINKLQTNVFDQLPMLGCLISDKTACFHRLGAKTVSCLSCEIPNIFHSTCTKTACNS